MRKEISFLLKLEAVYCNLQLYFKYGFHYSGYIIFPNQKEWIYKLFLNS